MRRLREEKYTRLILRTQAELDLTDQKIVQSFLQEETLEYVFVCAATVSGGQGKELDWKEE